MDQMNKFFSLGRPIDPNYPTNRAISVVTGLLIGVGTIYRLVLGQALIPSAIWGFNFGVAVFLAWVLAREVDPDHDLAAFVAAGLSLLSVWFLGPSGLLSLFGLVLILRIVNRTTGLPRAIFDYPTLLALTGLLVFQGNLVFGFIAVLALILDGWLTPPQRWSWLMAGITLLLTAGVFLFQRTTLGSLETSLPVLAGVAAVTVAFLPIIISSKQIRSVCDTAGSPLYPQRVQAAQAIALIALVANAFYDAASVIALSPLWAALVGVVVYRLFAVFLPSQESAS